MNKSEAKALIAKQDAYKEQNPGPFSGLAPGVNGGQLRKARRILDGEEKENVQRPAAPEGPIVGPLVLNASTLDRVAAELTPVLKAQAEKVIADRAAAAADAAEAPKAEPKAKKAPAKSKAKSERKGKKTPSTAKAEPEIEAAAPAEADGE